MNLFFQPRAVWGLRLRTAGLLSVTPHSRSASSSLLQIVALIAALAVSFVAHAHDVRISQVYGGSGNTGSPYNADFVELHNTGSSAVAIGGWAITYTSATGNFGGSQFTLPPGTLIPPSGYLLIQMSAAGGTGAALSPDLVANPAIGMAADNANVALLSAAQSGTSNNIET